MKSKPYSLALLRERSDIIDFDEPNHIYTHPNKPNLKFTSGTTVIKEFEPNPFDAQKISEKLSKGCEIKRAELLCSWSCSGPKGTYIHRIVELYCLSKLDRYNFPKGFSNPQAEALIEYIESLEQSGWKIFEPEMKIWDEEYRICGTADLIMKKKDSEEILIVDYKTCKSIPEKSFAGEKMLEPINNLDDSKYNHYALQLSLYQHMIEKNTGLVVLGRVLLQSSEDGVKAIIPVPYLEQEIKSMLAWRETL